MRTTPGSAPSATRALKSARNLEVLHLSDTPASDALMPALSGAKNLKELHLRRDPNVTVVGFANLKGCVKLEDLDIFGTSISGQALAQLRAYKKLKRVVWSADDGSKAALRKALPNCSVE